jgi:hypothetical protein
MRDGAATGVSNVAVVLADETEEDVASMRDMTLSRVSSVIATRLANLASVASLGW